MSAKVLSGGGPLLVGKDPPPERHCGSRRVRTRYVIRSDSMSGPVPLWCECCGKRKRTSRCGSRRLVQFIHAREGVGKSCLSLTEPARATLVFLLIVICGGTGYLQTTLEEEGRKIYGLLLYGSRCLVQGLPSDGTSDRVPLVTMVVL